MKLIIGGAFQGKKEYAKQQFHLTDAEMCDGGKAAYEDIFGCKCLYHFHEWVKRGMQENRDFENLENRIARENPELVIISNELGYGVVPMDAFDREYREKTGRICTKLAAKSSQVIRVVCGIGTVIKDA